MSYCFIYCQRLLPVAIARKLDLAPAGAVVEWTKYASGFDGYVQAVVKEPVDDVGAAEGMDWVEVWVSVGDVLDDGVFGPFQFIETDADLQFDGSAVAVGLEPAADGHDLPVVGALSVQHAGGLSVWPRGEGGDHEFAGGGCDVLGAAVGGCGDDVHAVVLEPWCPLGGELVRLASLVGSVGVDGGVYWWQDAQGGHSGQAK